MSAAAAAGAGGLRVHLVTRHADRARRLRLRPQLAGLSVAPVAAVTPQSAAFRAYLARRPALPAGITETEIACALSHQRALARIAASGAPGVVLEDDVTLRPGFRALLCGRPAAAVREGTLYHLGGLNGLVEAELLQRSRRPVERLAGVGFHAVIGRADCLLRACGYLVAPGTARRMTAAFAQGFYRADHWQEIAARAGIADLRCAPLLDHPRGLSGSALELARMQQRAGAGAAAGWRRRALVWLMAHPRLFDALKALRRGQRRLTPWYLAGRLARLRAERW
jgi:hypothetical protein